MFYLYRHIETDGRKGQAVGYAMCITDAGGNILNHICKAVTVIAAIIFIVSVFLHKGAFAEIYSYTDENGRIFYTNSLESVPARFRKNVKVDSEIKRTLPQQTGFTGTQTEEIKPGAAESKSRPTYDPARGNELKKKAKKLEDEFRALEEERKRLEAERSGIKTRAGLKEYTKKLESYKQRAEDYRKRKAALEKEIKEHKARVKAYLEGTLDQLEKKKKNR